MKAFGYAATRLLPLAAGVGLSAAYFQTLLGIVIGVLTALGTAFTTIEAGMRVYEKVQAKRAASKSPRTKSDE